MEEILALPMPYEGQRHNELMSRGGRLKRWLKEQPEFLSQCLLELAETWNFGSDKYEQREISQIIERITGQEQAGGLISRKVLTGSKPDLQLLRATIQKNQIRAVDFYEASPRKFGAAYTRFVHPESEWKDDDAATEVLTALYPDGGMICAGIGKYSYNIFELSKVLDRARNFEYLVPNRMLPELVDTEVLRSAANVGPLEYLVVECDFKEDNLLYRDLLRAVQADLGITPLDAGLSVICELINYQDIPLVVIVFSGGKSFHGWFRIADLPFYRVKEFMKRAVLLGSDPAMERRNQFFRMPGGLRCDGSRQCVLYFDASKV